MKGIGYSVLVFGAVFIANNDTFRLIEDNFIEHNKRGRFLWVRK